MKRPLLLFLISVFNILFTDSSRAQTYSNSWITYGQPYYKFKILNDQVIYQIPFSTLATAGLNDVKGPQFVLYKNGKEVPLYIYIVGQTNDTGYLTTGSYIEFYGTKNDGWVDSALYQNNGQANTKFSMFTDSSAYYLSYNNKTHLRYTLQTNSLTGHAAAQPYCLYTLAQVNVQRNYNYYFEGLAACLWCQPELYLPEWDNGEGYLDVNSGIYGPNSSYSYAFNTPYVYTGSGPLATVTGQIWGYSFSNHEVYITINGAQISGNYTGNTVCNMPFNNPFSPSFLKPVTQATINCSPYANVEDVDYLAHMELQYPRLFNFGANSVFHFMVPGSSAETQFLDIYNYNAKGTTPQLFDLTNLIVMPGVFSKHQDSVYFNLPGSNNNRDLLLTSQDPSDIATISSFQKINFVDYTNPANEGDYIIISNPVLFNDGSGNNYVQQFANFKQSCGYHPIVVDINQLYDQFAYGVTRHPLSIRNFALYARQHWTIKPKYIFIIGKGTEWENVDFSNDFNDNPAIFLPLCLVPTYGTPGSDELFTATNYDPTPAIPVGRLSTTNPADIEAYLEKVKDFVSNQTTFPMGQTMANKLWQKDILHFAGGSNAEEQMDFQHALLSYQNIIQGPLYGAHVTSFYKTSTNPIQQATSNIIDSIVNNGVSLMTFYGHASPNSFDYNIDHPIAFNNYKKYPMMLSLGCYLGDIFLSTPGLSEEWVNIPQKGAIAFLASSYVAESNNLEVYAEGFYRSIGQQLYNNSIGDAVKYATTYVFDSINYDILEKKLATEQMVLNGDPSLGLNNHPKPDYVLNDSVVHFSPAVVTAANDTFDVVVYPTNIGMAIDTSIYISVTRTFPSGNVQLLYQQKIKAPYYQDSIPVRFKVYVDSTIGYGLNKFTVDIDSKNQIDEITKSNNSVTIELYINGEDILPAYPYNYSIVNLQNITNNKGLVLKASTVNPFAALHKYDLQIDTTALFNSPLMQSTVINQIGGVVKWKPTITLHDSTVYYWRTAVDTIAGTPNWHVYSFIYLPQSSPGWNQSHYYQYLNDAYGDVYDGTDRKFHFINNVKSISATTGVSQFGSPSGPLPYDQIAYYLNSSQDLYDNCVNGPHGSKSRFMLAVFDSSSGLPLQCPPVGGAYGLHGSINIQDYALNGFFFDTNKPNMVDSLIVLITKYTHKGDYVLGFTIDQGLITSFSPALLAALKTVGCTNIDTTTFDRPYMFFGKKESSTGNKATEILATATLQTIAGNFIITGHWDEGFIQSPVIGPAVQWTSFHWKRHALQKPATDSASVTIYGVNGSNVPVLLYKAFTGTDLALNFINPKIYPTILVQENTTDTTNKTPAQLNFWRVNYQPVPDAALNPNTYLTLQHIPIQSLPHDSLQQGQQFAVGVDVDNITDYNMDSLWMKYIVTTSTGNSTPLFTKYHPLPANDSLHANFNMATTSTAPGLDNLFIEANPYAHHQPEEYHYNNLGDIPFTIKKDITPPILDVTFDGIHILNNDIVSAKPDILMRLKDENPYLALNDTNSAIVYVIYPNSNTPTRIWYGNGSVMTFTSAPSTNLNSTDNICTINYKPTFTVDGTYTLIVQSQDRTGNTTGTNAYQVSFEVINKEMISSILNYPNPFTTSTRFVFTLTGSQIPTFFKIEIMTITGKIIKEITLNDIGPLHIGTNISQYAWNGTDQYGNPVGNGLYLYHVVASMDGQAISHYNSEADQYIKSGFGKMYLMR